MLSSRAAIKPNRTEGRSDGHANRLADRTAWAEGSARLARRRRARSTQLTGSVRDRASFPAAPIGFFNRDIDDPLGCRHDPSRLVSIQKPTHSIQRSAGNSRLTPLPSGEGADHADTPVFEQGRLDPNQLLKEAGSPNLAPLKALELPHRPSHERQIDVSEHGLQRRAVVSPVVPDPPRRSGLSTLAMSSSERRVCCRIFKSRTVDRMAFSAEGLTAGVKLQNSLLSRELLTVRSRNWYPRKSNVTFGYLPVRLPSLQ